MAEDFGMTVNEIKDILMSEYDYKASHLNNKRKAELIEILSEEENKEEVKAEENVSSSEQSSADEMKEQFEIPEPPKKIERDRMVTVMSGVHGKLIYKNKQNGQKYVMNRFGDYVYLEYQELQMMRSSQPKFIENAWIIILDDEVVDAMGLKDKYKGILQPKELKWFFKLSPEKIKSRLEEAPQGVKELVYRKAREMVKDGSLDSKKRIEAIEKTLNADLED